MFEHRIITLITLSFVGFTTPFMRNKNINAFQPHPFRLKSNLAQIQGEIVDSKTLTILSGDSASTESELNSLLEKMPVNEKYSLLLQSYATRILESKKKDINLLEKMEGLYKEMIQKRISPDGKGSSGFLDAAASFCSVDKLSRALRLMKAAGTVKIFGVANGQITSPVVNSDGLSMINIDVPSDDREVEVLFASVAFATSISWIVMQVVSYFNEDLHPWATLLSTLILGLGALDVSFQQAKSIRQAAAGLDRLILRDDERQAHCDGSAFLAGYLLGLPCFCYKADVGEAIRLLGDAPNSLVVYKQPAALKASAAASVMGLMDSAAPSRSSFGQLFQGFKGSLGMGANADSPASSSSAEIINILPPEPTLEEEEKLFGVGRILVWLMAPVAAEYLKYGKTILSDPRRSKKFIAVLNGLKQKQSSSSSSQLKDTTKDINDNLESSSNQKNANILLKLPETFPTLEADQAALLQWAYFEATAIVKQYGDLLEDVSSYLSSGTSTVGECAFMIEKEMS
mmetsp:Transcript_8471/g.12622  ORF Transcript_8471/g.12622 Transcript_8471/m.12622 type:complete len:515 (+) Transcript_8471:2-1546(+)